MKRFLLSLLLTLGLVLPALGQVPAGDLKKLDSGLADRVNFSAVNDLVWIDYYLKKDATIQLYVSLDGGLSFLGPLNEVSGDAGDVKGWGYKHIVWSPVNEFGGLNSDKVLFRVVSVSNKPLALDEEQRLSLQMRRSWGHLKVGDTNIRTKKQLKEWTGNDTYSRDFTIAKISYALGWPPAVLSPIFLIAASQDYGEYESIQTSWEQDAFMVAIKDEVRTAAITEGIVGLVLAGASFVLFRASAKNLNQIANDYNRKNEIKRQYLQMGVTQNGIGVSYNF